MTKAERNRIDCRARYAKNREARRAAAKAYREKNPEQIRESRRKAHAKAPEKWAERSRNWYSQNKDRVRVRQAAKKYGISKERAAALLTAKCCGICGQEKPLHIDHCHATGRVRGMLCSHCNTGLGGFRDDPRLLTGAILYLAGIIT